MNDNAKDPGRGKPYQYVGIVAGVAVVAGAYFCGIGSVFFTMLLWSLGAISMAMYIDGKDMAALGTEEDFSRALSDFITADREYWGRDDGITNFHAMKTRNAAYDKLHAMYLKRA